MGRSTPWFVTGVVVAVAISLYFIPKQMPDRIPDVVEVNQQNFDSLVDTQDRTILFNFWTSECPPSLEHDAILKRISKQYEGDIIVASVNLDEHETLGHRFDIQRIPTMIFMKNRKILKRAVGVHSEDLVHFQVAEAIRLSAFLNPESTGGTKRRDESTIQDGPVR